MVWIVSILWCMLFQNNVIFFCCWILVSILECFWNLSICKQFWSGFPLSYWKPSITLLKNYFLVSTKVSCFISNIFPKEHKPFFWRFWLNYFHFDFKLMFEQGNQKSEKFERARCGKTSRTGPKLVEKGKLTQFKCFFYTRLRLWIYFSLI